MPYSTGHKTSRANQLCFVIDRTMAGVPATVFNELTERVNALIGRDRFVDEYEPQLLELFREAARLRKVDPGGAENIRGCLYAVSGNIGAAENAFNRAMNFASSDRPEIPLNYAITLGNLGQFSKVQALFRSYGAPQYGMYGPWANLGLLSGAFISLEKFGRAASSDLKFEGTQLLSLYGSGAKILSQARLPEEFIADVLDLAGKILFERRITFTGTVPSVEVIDDYQTIQYTFDVRVSFSDAAEMNFELATSIAEAHDIMPEQLLIGFRGMH